METLRPAPAALPPTLAACWPGIRRLIGEAVRMASPEERAELDDRMARGDRFGLVAVDDTIIVTVVDGDGAARPWLAAPLAGLLAATDEVMN